MKRLFLSFLTMLLLGGSLAWSQEITVSGTVTVNATAAEQSTLSGIKLLVGCAYNPSSIAEFNPQSGGYTYQGPSGEIQFGLCTNNEPGFVYGDGSILSKDWVFVDGTGAEVNPMKMDLTESTTVNLTIKPKNTGGGGGGGSATLIGRVDAGMQYGMPQCLQNVAVSLSKDGANIAETTTKEMDYDKYYSKLSCMYGYKFENLAKGTYTLTYSKDGYNTQTKEVEITEDGVEKIAPPVTLVAKPVEYIFEGYLSYLNGDNQTVKVEGATVTAYDGVGGNATVLGTATTNAQGYWTMSLACAANATVYFDAEHPNIVVAQRASGTAVYQSGNNVTISCTEKVPDLLPVETAKARQIGDELKVKVSWTWPQDLIENYKTAEGGVYKIKKISIYRPNLREQNGRYIWVAGEQIGSVTAEENQLPPTSFIDEGVLCTAEQVAGTAAFDYVLGTPYFEVGREYKYSMQIEYAYPAGMVDIPNTAALTVTISAAPVVRDSVTLTLEVNNEGWGTVTGAGKYEKGDEVMIRATPARGYLFKEWQQGGQTYATTAEYKATLNADLTLTAVFEERPPIYDSVTLTINVNNETWGTVEGAGKYAKGETVTVKATPKEGYSFKQWKSGTTILSTKPTYTFVAESDMTITAEFGREVVYRGMINGRARQISQTSVRLDWEWPQALIDDYKKADGSGLYEISQVIIKRKVVSETYVMSDEVATLRPADYTLPATTYTEISTEDRPLGIGATYSYFFQVLYMSPATKTVEVNTDGSDEMLKVTMVEDVEPVHHYTVTLEVNNEDMGVVAGGGDHFEEGDEVTVTATAKPDYVFQCWKEGEEEVSKSATYTFIISGDRTLTAVFAPRSAVTMFTLNVNVNDQTMGTVSINGMSSQEAEFAEGTSVTVTARPNEGYKFVAWKNGETEVSTNAVYTFDIEEDLTLTAVFAVRTIENYTVTLICDETMGTVTGAGVYEGDSKVTVTATPKPGYLFKGWQENGEMLNGAGATYEFFISGNRTLTAVFSDKVDVKLLVNNPSMGTVEGEGQYTIGAEVTVKATPKPGYMFQRWTAGQTEVATTAEYKFVVSTDTTLTAVFAQNPNAEKVTLKLEVNDEAMGTVEGAGEYFKGAEVTVKAVAKEGYRFRGWDNDGEMVSTEAEYTFTLEEDLTLTAVFSQGSIVGGFATLTLEVNDETMGTVEGAGRYEKGVGVTVKAIPYLGYVFQAWKNGEETVSTEAEYTFTIEDNLTLMAVFAPGDANEHLELADWSVYVENGRIVLRSNTACRYEVYTVSGVLVNQGRMDADACSIAVDHSGLYMVRRISATGISVKKVVVR